MPASRSDGTQIRVDVAALREAADVGRQDVSMFRSIIDEMDQAMNASESFWEGDAAELYRNVFRREISAMRQVFEAFAAYTNDLTAYADGYAGVDNRADAIANDAVQAVWADV